jgi:hypothetical protein
MPHPWYCSWCWNSSPTHSPQRNLNTFFTKDRITFIVNVLRNPFPPPPPNTERRFDAPLGHSDPGGTPNTNTAVAYPCTYYGRPSFDLDCTNEPQLANIQIIQLTLAIQPTFFQRFLIFRTSLTQMAPLFHGRKQ